MAKRLTPIAIGVAGGIVTILLCAVIAGPIMRAVHDGASRWMLCWIASPLPVALFGCFLGTRFDRKQQTENRPAASRWHVWDEELPPDLSSTERRMLARSGHPVDARLGEVADMLGIHPRGGAR